MTDMFGALFLTIERMFLDGSRNDDGREFNGIYPLFDN